MKCNINRRSTDRGLYTPDLAAIVQGLQLLEEDIQGFLQHGNFSDISKEDAEQNLAHIASVRQQLKNSQQSFHPNELKVIYVGLNFLRDDLAKPAGQRSPLEDGLTEEQILQKQRDVSITRQKIVAAFSRMGVDIDSVMRGV